MSRLMLRYAADESGASAVEYALVASLIAVAIVAAAGTLGISLRNKAYFIARRIGAAGT